MAAYTRRVFLTVTSTVLTYLIAPKRRDWDPAAAWNPSDPWGAH